MSLKDDFLEALRSVKRDFFRDSEYIDQPPQEQAPQPPSAAGQEPVGAAPVTPPPARPEPPSYTPEPVEASDREESEYAPPQPDEVVFEAFNQASTLDDGEQVVEGAGELPDEEDFVSDTTPFRSFDPSGVDGGDYDGGGDGRIIDDFDDGGIFGDDKTIISKNTVIRGAVETQDSVRLLGQVLGDINCKSNIVVAGKVRGNTTAANAYIFDAQVDGDVRCDDVINISNDAWILGNVRAQQAEIDGKIKGNIEIRHMVSIGPSSSVLGDISADELEIKRGAFVNGQIMMYSPSRDVLDRFDSFEE